MAETSFTDGGNPVFGRLAEVRASARLAGHLRLAADLPDVPLSGSAARSMTGGVLSRMQGLGSPRLGADPDTARGPRWNLCGPPAKENRVFAVGQKLGILADPTA